VVFEVGLVCIPWISECTYWSAEEHRVTDTQVYSVKHYVVHFNFDFLLSLFIAKAAILTETSSITSRLGTQAPVHCIHNLVLVNGSILCSRISSYTP